MHIIELQAENMKRIRAVAIRPGDAAIVPICGKNGQGKTSVLDSIWWALAGARGIQAEPIRNDAERAMIKLDLGEFVVVRTFNRVAGNPDKTFTTELKVTNAKGRRIPNGQDALNGLLSSIAFDPMAFARASDTEKVAALQRLVVDFDFAQYGKQRAAAFEARRDHNRDVKAYTSTLETLPIAPPPSGEDADTIMAEADRAQAHNAEQDKRAKALADANERDGRIVAEIRTLQERIAALEGERQQLMDDMLELPEPEEKIDLEPLRERLRNVQSSASARAAYEQRQAVERQLAEATAAANEQDEEIKRLDAARDAAVAAAPLPAGIEFADGAVRLNGVPFEQASDAQRLQASLAIAMAGNPELRVIRIRDGSLLDDDAMKAVAEFAAEKDFQVWIERVGDGDESGFVISDGAVVREPAADAGGKPGKKARELAKGGEYRGGPVA